MNLSRSVRPMTMPRTATIRARVLVIAATAGLLATTLAVAPAPAEPVAAGSPSFYTKYVDDAGAGGGIGGNCTAAEYGPDAYGNGAEGAIEAAITAAGSGGTVVLCDGTHSLTDGTDGVAISVGVITIRGESTANTIVDGGGATRLFDGNSGPADVTFIGLTLRNGYDASGEGAAVRAGNVTAIGARFIANRAGDAGGAIYASDDVTTSWSVYQDNTAGTDGGAVYAGATARTFHDRFTGNEATGDGGGAVYADGDIESTGGIYVDNSSPAGLSGGGALFSRLTVTSHLDEFTANTASYGGAIYSDAAVSVRTSTFEENAASGQGGAIYVYFYCSPDCEPTTISDGTFTRNFASDGGGAVYVECDSGDCHAVDSSGGTYTDNSTGIDAYGGAIATYGDFTSRYDTFSGNRADQAGGAAYVNGSVVSSAATYIGNSSLNNEGGALWVRDLLWSLHDTFVDNTAGNGDAGAIYGDGNLDVDGITFSITDGTFLSNSSGDEGGAIYLSNNSIALWHTTFTGNSTADYDGGAMWVNDSVYSWDGVYEDNTADTNISRTVAGGAIYTSSGGVTSVRDMFKRNSATGPGGAIFASSEVVVTDGTFTDNTAGIAPDALQFGGAIVAGAGASVLRTSFLRNSGSAGGAISTEAKVVAVDSTFGTNYASESGGAIIAGAGVDVTGGTFEGNSAAGTGGAIDTYEEVTIDRSTFVGNSGNDYGGAVAQNNPGATMSVVNSTFVSNLVSGSNSGGAIYSSGNLYASFSTFIDNSTGGGDSYGDALSTDNPNTLHFDHVLIVGAGPDAVDCWGLTDDAGFSIETGYTCLRDDGTSTGSQISVDSTSGTDRADLHLGTFANHGGRTPTYSLSDGSLAIDFDEDVEACASIATTDQRGVGRPQGDGCDTGAYEFGGGAVPLYNGPWWVNSSTAVRALSLAALVDPATAGCVVRFDVSGATWTTSGPTGETTSFTTSGVSRSDGSVSAPLANVPLGLYDVTVTIAGGCSGSGSDAGVLGVLPGSVARGTVGGGWYRLADAGGWRKSSFSDIVSVSSSYSKRTGVTTTTTKGQLSWYSAADNSTMSGGSGWRLRATISRTTTDGTSPWQPIACPAGVGTTGSEARCGRYTGTGLLEQRRRSGRWEPAPYGTAGRVTFTVTVYDGGRLTTCARKVCKTVDLDDWFGIAIVGVPTPTSASDKLPQVGAPVRLKSGSLRNS